MMRSALIFSLANCRASPSCATAARTTSQSPCSSAPAKRRERPSLPTSLSHWIRCGWLRETVRSRTPRSASEPRSSASSSCRDPRRSRCCSAGMPMTPSSSALAAETVQERLAASVWALPPPAQRTRNSMASLSARRSWAWTWTSASAWASRGWASTRTVCTEQKSCHPERMTTRRNSTCQGAWSQGKSSTCKTPPLSRSSTSASALKFTGGASEQPSMRTERTQVAANLTADTRHG
mmetsp:Transcript_71323/g.212733  ORF Transcript_71323/g.212733 Transcript_71323/m.212733 type:complete len:237 (+) Transcript_71323:340-1050(+)